MPQTVNLVLMVVLVILPLFIVFSSRVWPRTQAKVVLVVLPLGMFLITAPLHEVFHIVATYLVGGTVEDVNLIQRFWVDGAEKAGIRTSGLTTASQGVFTSMFPYLTDIASLLIGTALAHRVNMKSAWYSGVFLLVLILRPSFDICANVICGSVFRTGDFFAIANTLGAPSAYVIETLFILAAVVATIRVVAIYRSRLGDPVCAREHPVETP